MELQNKDVICSAKSMKKADMKVGDELHIAKVSRHVSDVFKLRLFFDNLHSPSCTTKYLSVQW